MLYNLMHKDNKVAIMRIDENKSIDKVKIINPEIIPPAGALSIEHLRRWWKNREIPMTQGNIKNILKKLGINDSSEFLYRNLGLSLSDHYWIRPVNKALSWKDVNLYQNDFKDITEVSKNNFQKEYTVSFSPVASSIGDLKKKWIIGDDGSRYLIKGNGGSDAQQSINECFASYFHEKQGFSNFVSYELVEVPSGDGIIQPHCICKSFTSLQYEFIPAYDISLSEKKRNDVSEYEHIINICKKHGLNESVVRDFLEYQILSDFLMTNTDRHFNNFGMLRDTDTLEYVKMAPIFDTGNSMFWDNARYINKDNLLNIQTNSFKTTEIDLLKYITNKNLIDLSNLPTKNDVYEFYTSYKLPVEKAEIITKLYSNKNYMLERFVEGKEISLPED